MRHLDGLPRKTPSCAFSCVIPNMPILQVGKSRFRAVTYLFQRLAATKVLEPELKPGSI